MTTLVSVDGQLRQPEDAVVSVFDRGFLYGDSVFETIRTYGGKPFALTEHLERLQRSADLVFIDLPTSPSALAGEIRQVLAASGNEESYVRVTVTRGSGEMGLDPALARGPTRVIIVSELTPPPPEHYESGIAVVSWLALRAGDVAGVRGAKVGNYLVSVLAMREARRVGAQEAIIVDEEGHVLEGASSNLFFVSGGVVVTPPVDAGILPGITRKYLLETCAGQGIEVELRTPTLDEVKAADEAFISSSIRELLPVVRVDGQEIGTGRPGPVTRRLLEQFRRRVRGES